METVEIISIDRATLPGELLPIAKTHMRVSYNDDDAYIQLCLQRAIDLFERHSGRCVFETVAFWEPVRSAQRLLLPLIPVQSFTAADATGNDVTNEYEIKGGDYFQRKDGAPVPAGMMITLTCGFAAMADLPPSPVDITLRVSAYFYENRESVTSYGLEQVPQWMNDLLLGNWVPRA
ncbi:hypothetical protein [Ensifer canadensis]|uniref:hypothetical protein n=1 Tax=Ensifer canadensis TaxID=555315 RepID=UPI0035E3C18D